jgi:hypothetical protein
MLQPMFSLFKRKPVVAAGELTFKVRVTRFWDWYAGVAERFYQTIEEKKCPDLASEVSAKIDEVLPKFAWVFGPGADGQGHSFTLSGEGNGHKQLLAVYWQSQAPKIPGWTFYHARQPSLKNPGDIRLKIGGEDFEAAAFWLTPFVNVEQKRIELTAWHPLFPKLDERARWTVLFLLLDEALGEIGTQNWIGEIQMNDTKLSGAMPLAELRGYLERVQAEHHWKKGGPGESWSLYRFEAQATDGPRSDIYVGTTCAMALINEFSEAKGQLADPLAGTGADYVYVAFDISILPKGKEADTRGEFEDALTAVLEPAASGRVTGGAMGRRQAYIDLLLFNGTASITLVLETLRRLRLPAGTSINYFAHEKRGHRVVL